VDAFKLHLEKTLEEIKELCENGSGENYYAFENLITHMRANKEYHRSKEAMESLLKITLFSNLALISALEVEFFPNSQLPQNPTVATKRELMLEV
jgi:hypothetical protein